MRRTPTRFDFDSCVHRRFAQGDLAIFDTFWKGKHGEVNISNLSMRTSVDEIRDVHPIGFAFAKALQSAYNAGRADKLELYCEGSDGRTRLGRLPDALLHKHTQSSVLTRKVQNAAVMAFEFKNKIGVKVGLIGLKKIEAHNELCRDAEVRERGGGAVKLAAR